MQDCQKERENICDLRESSPQTETGKIKIYFHISRPMGRYYILDKKDNFFNF